MTADGLNEKQARFVAEYMIDLNATQAATRAGYSAKTAYAIGHELLKKPEIQAALTAAMDDRSERTQITADRVLEELARIGFADIRKLFDEDGSLRDVADMDPDTVAAIASIELQVFGPSASFLMNLASMVPATLKWSRTATDRPSGGAWLNQWQASGGT